jgi:hypothetical protein
MQDVPKIVRQQLEASKSVVAESHPDADLLTAFAEQALVGREREFVIDHLARCGDCRDVVVLALPATEAVAVPAVSGARIGWFSRPGLRWGVVAAGLLIVTSVGVLQYRQRHREETVASNIGQNDASARTAAQNAPVLPQAPASAAATPQSELDREKNETGALAMSSQPMFPERKAAPRAGATFRQLSPMNRASAAKAGSARGVGAGVGSDSAAGFAPSAHQDFGRTQAVNSPVPAEPQASPPAATQQVEVSGASQVVEVQSEAAQITTEVTAQNQISDQVIQNRKELPLNGRNVANLGAVAKAKDPVPAQAAASAAPGPIAPPGIPLQTSPALMLRVSPRWGISAAGMLQRSFDAGKTWEGINPSANLIAIAASKTVESATPADGLKTGQDVPEQAAANLAKKIQKAKASPDSSLLFRAVAASGLEVWAGGSGGALYHTVDGGNRWTLVLPAAAGTILTGDIISIQFPDPQHGTVATSSAEVWTTTDDGQTWSKEQ